MFRKDGIVVPILQIRDVTLWNVSFLKVPVDVLIPTHVPFYHLSFGYNGQRLCIKLRVWGVQGQQTVNSPFRECMEAASRLSGRCRGRYRVRANVLQPTMHVPASSVDPDFIRPQMFCHKTCLMMHSDVLQAPETFKRSILLLVEDFDCGKSLFFIITSLLFC